MEYKGKLYGKNGTEIFPLMMHSDDVDMLEMKVMMCQGVIEHLAAWFEGATLEPIKIKRLVERIRHNTSVIAPDNDKTQPKEIND